MKVVDSTYVPSIAYSPPDLIGEDNSIMPYIAQIVYFNHPDDSVIKKYNEEEEDEEMTGLVKRPLKKKKTHSTIPESIYFFHYDVYVVGSNGNKPGRFVFLTKDRRFNTDKFAMEWKVEDVMSRKRTRRKTLLAIEREEESSWFEFESNLKRRKNPY